ncbi:hypothetical protein GCM10017556_58530 [Micromonospora sagamiensis]|nr:hypothetical protein GCM10017556_58530 [Micromonospora sagamiensis]
MSPLGQAVEEILGGISHGDPPQGHCAPDERPPPHPDGVKSLRWARRASTGTPDPVSGGPPDTVTRGSQPH